MKFSPSLLFILGIAGALTATNAQADPTVLKVNVGNQERQALVYAPTAADKSAQPPAVFLFSPHAIPADDMAERTGLAAALPETVVVSMEGLPSPGMFADVDGTQSGWQFAKGQSDDRDLKFFDAILPRLEEEFKIDRKRIYIVGAGNGGFFAYLLWSERPAMLAAVAAGACKILPEMKLTKPLPALHFLGENDMRVLLREHEETIAELRKLNGCADEGKSDSAGSTVYSSSNGTPLTVFIDSSGNNFSPEAVKATIKFLKEQAAKPAR